MIGRSKCMNVPEIRFNDSLIEWSKKNFLSEVSIYSGLTYSPNDIRTQGTLVLRSSNVQEGNVSLNDNVYVNSFIVNSPNVQKGDIIIVVRNGSQSLIGKHAIIKQEMPNTVIGAFMTGLHCKNNSNFINALLSSTKFKKEIYKNLGATINQITNKTLTSMEFMFPKENDMYNIGCFFEKLDSLIQTTSKELTSLKRIKAASLQSMFPQKGETVPKVRFKGFEEEWKYEILGKISSISIGEFVIQTKQRANAPYPVYNGGITNTGYYDYFNQEGPKIIISARGANAGFISKYENRFWAGNSCYSIGINNNNWEFIYYFLQSKQDSYLKEQQAANIPSISKKQIYTTNVLLPCYNEQIKIGLFFSNLDKQISLQTQRLEKLKQIKAACLDKMFV